MSSPATEQADGTWPPQAALVVAEVVAVTIAVVALWLGAQTIEGTFGITGERVGCGSVWGLVDGGDLNAATCTGDLRSRVALVSLLLGGGLLIGLGAPLVLRRQGHQPVAHEPAWMTAAVLIPVTVAIGLVVAGRHLIWSISGG